jgi:hypothetical protein
VPGAPYPAPLDTIGYVTDGSDGKGGGDSQLSIQLKSLVKSASAIFSSGKFGGGGFGGGGGAGGESQLSGFGFFNAK